MKNSVETKRLDYEKRMGLSPSVVKKQTSIKNISFDYLDNREVVNKSFDYLEDLVDFLKCLNPRKLAEVKIATATMLEISGLGAGLKGKILNF